MTEPDSTSFPDPLIDEVRAIRKKISDRYGNDVHKLGEHLREIEQQYKDRLVTLEEFRKRRPSA